MKPMNVYGSILGMLATLMFSGCANMESGPAPVSSDVTRSGNVYSGYGVVQSIELVKHEKSGIGGSGIGLGTVAGAVIGGVVGNQIGSGSGKTVATVIGAAGGGYVGHEIENRQQQTEDTYKITVRMDDGSYQSVLQSTHSGFRVGDRVRFNNGVLERY